MKRILILGSSGLLGSNLYKKLKKHHKVFHNGLINRKINTCNIYEIKALIKKTNPNIILNCAAVTNIEYAEKNKKLTYNVNVNTVKNLIFLKKKFKFRLIQFSTDSFYNQKKSSIESSKKKFFNFYSKSKYLAEKICHKSALVLRINFFGYTKKSKSFTDFIYKSFLYKKKFYLFEDVYFSPLRIDTLCKIVLKIINNFYNVNGIYNLGSKDFLSKSQFAIKFAKHLKIYKSKYIITSSDKILNVKRSKYMNMNVNKFEKKFQINLPKLQNEIISEANLNYKK